MIGKKPLLVAWFATHFLLVLLVSCRDAFSILARARTLFPNSLKTAWQQGEEASSTVLGESLPIDNSLRQLVATYLHAAGIQAGYGFFAPNVPNSYKLVLELHYPDSRMEYEVPRVQTPSAGARLTNVYDIIGRTDYSPLRVTMLKMLSYSVWKNHPEATSIRAVFGFIREPTPDEFKHGVRESYEFLYAYDFSFSDLTVPSAP